MNILEIKDVSKSFDGKKIVDDVSFNIEQGKIVGLLGKNGSGKTTIIKMINDLLTVDSGSILIDGQKISEKTKAVVSYLPERTYLESDQKVLDVFFIKDKNVQKETKCFLYGNVCVFIDWKRNIK